MWAVRRDLLLAFLFSIVISLAPFPYGAVTPDASWYLACALFALASLCALLGARPTRGTLLPLFLLSAVAMVGVFQLLPLSPAALGRLSPESIAAYQRSNVILATHHFGRITPRISIAPGNTVRAILDVAAIAAAFGLGSSLLKRARTRWMFLSMLLLSAITHVIWAASTEERGTLTRMHGAFINPNHFAGYLECILPFPLALGIAVLFKRRKLRKDSSTKRVFIASGFALIWCALFAGIGLSRSRAAVIISALASALLLLLLVLRLTSDRYDLKLASRRTVAAILTAVAAVAVVVTTLQGTLILRFMTTDPKEVAAESRLQLWRASLDAWRRFPHFGSGLGTFPDAFRLVQSAEVEGLVEQAHSEALQMLVTGGWVGLTFSALAVGAALWALHRAFRRETYTEEIALTSASIAAVLTLLIHGIVEFNFSIQAIPVTLAALAGLGLAASNQEE